MWLKSEIALLWLLFGAINSQWNSNYSELSTSYHVSDGQLVVRFVESDRVDIAVWNSDELMLQADDSSTSEADPVDQSDDWLTMSNEPCNKRVVSSNSKRGWLTTPGFPFGYAYNTSCTYRFEGGKRERIRLVFDSFDLSTTEHASAGLVCANNTDRVIVRSNSTSNDDLLVAVLCGSGDAQQFMSASNSISVFFLTAPNVLRTSARGFNLTYAFVTDFGVSSGAQVGTECRFFYDSSSKLNGTFSSPNFPGEYPLDTECNYEFRGQRNQQVQIWLPVFDVRGLHQCQEKLTSDYLEIQDYAVLAKEAVVTRWCTQRNATRHYRSVGNRVVLKFKSNSQYAGIGFDGYYEFLSTVQIAPLSSGGTPHLSTNLLLTFLISLLMSVFSYPFQ